MEEAEFRTFLKVIKHAVSMWYTMLSNLSRAYKVKAQPSLYTRPKSKFVDTTTNGYIKKITSRTLRVLNTLINTQIIFLQLPQQLGIDLWDPTRSFFVCAISVGYTYK